MASNGHSWTQLAMIPQCWADWFQLHPATRLMSTVNFSEGLTTLFSSARSPFRTLVPPSYLSHKLDNERTDM
ncbi:jg19834 [Pararge aegeria aegeria]|uniref:Jg19834 protein n=1 Tax=Pararge aegeria aegeria TaxID=348720 RepID=A0A8S4SHD8_9NEOP|nr:jg19834 [Pararge aegeria aegeria]